MRESFRLSALILSLPLLLVACGGGYGRPDSVTSQLGFGVDMAKHSLWSEALFRFHQAERLDPNNPRVYNNLAVAYEATGDYQKALEHYQKALKLDPNNRDLRANYARFVEFYQGFKTDKAPGEKPPVPSAAGPEVMVGGRPKPEPPAMPEPQIPEPPSSPVRPPLP
jgi:tetratricopeptide (TPR) repeat protein